MGFDKIRALLGGRTVLEWSLRVFHSLECVDRIVVVCPRGQRPEFAQLTKGYAKIGDVVEGRSERPGSVLAGAEALQELGCGGLVAVHDGARPLILTEAIERCRKAAEARGAAALAERVVDTLHRTDPDHLVTGSVTRENLWRVQTPQILSLGDLIAMQGGQGFTDEVSALLAAKKNAVLIENHAPNFKITVPGDLLLAEAVLQSRLQ